MDTNLFDMITLFLKIGLIGTIASMLFLLSQKSKKKDKVFKIIAGVSGVFLGIEIIGSVILLNQLQGSNKDIVKNNVQKKAEPVASSKNKVEEQISKETEISLKNSNKKTDAKNKDGKIDSKDYEIIISPDTKELHLTIWDFAYEDGDYVQLLQGNKQISDPFMITNEYRTFTIPVNEPMQIKGIIDGGGGITYALYVRETGETYYNNAPKGGFNTYTITKAK